MLNRESTIKEIYANPVGHDVLGKVLMQLGKSDRLITNPLIGSMKLGTLEKLAGKKLQGNFIDTLLDLLNSEQDGPVKASGSKTKAWWKEAVFYQIYPRSFCDSNNDGIGDLQGIISKLDYLKDLGVDAIWLSPIYDSPMDDNGYDIRDYNAILKDFGTMEDFDLLLKEVHDRGMRLIMDLVVNHTSDEHEWFKKGLKDPSSKYRDYYFFRDGSKEAPNNWTSFFSGSAWNRYEEEDTWALHLFSKKQMDLNWDNKDVRDDVINMINGWLDKGVDGFRMDVINYISKRDGLPQGDEFVGGLMGYTGIENYYYGPNLHKYLREIRERAFDPHGAFSVGETPGLGMEMSKLVTAEERKELDMVFSFDHLETPGHTRFDDYVYDLNYYRDYIIHWAENYGDNCQMSLFYDNHDNPRMVSKVNPDGEMSDVVAKLLAVMQLTLPGTPFIFQGEELALTNYPFESMEDINDVESKGLYEELCKKVSPEEAFKIILAGTRDHARVLLPWNKNAPYTQIVDKSVTECYRKLIAFRKKTPAITYGSFEVIRKRKGVFTYRRTFGDTTVVVDCNLGEKVRIAYEPGLEYKLVYDSNCTERFLIDFGVRVFVKDNCE